MSQSCKLQIYITRVHHKRYWQGKFTVRIGSRVGQWAVLKLRSCTAFHRNSTPSPNSTNVNLESECTCRVGAWCASGRARVSLRERSIDHRWIFAVQFRHAKATQRLEARAWGSWGLQNRPQGPPKSTPDTPKSRSGASLGAKMHPKSISEQPGGAQERPGSAQEAPKERPRGSRAAQERPRAGQVVPKPSQNEAPNPKISMLNSKSFLD